MTTSTAYAHHRNLQGVAGEAATKARSSAIADGTAWTVRAAWVEGEPFHWTGSRHDALALAKDLVFNGAHAVALVAPSGEVLTESAIRSARY